MEIEPLSKRLWVDIVAAPMTDPSHLHRILVACDAIESRDCAGLSGVATAAEFIRQIGEKINLTSVDRYLMHRRRTEPGFIAPARASLNRAHYKAVKDYINQRERERSKTPPRTGSNRRRMVNEALSRIDNHTDRTLLAEVITEETLSRVRADNMQSFLRNEFPGFNYDDFISGQPFQKVEFVLQLDQESRDILRRLIQRLADEDTLRACGLQLKDDRIKGAARPYTTVIEPAELKLLRRLVQG